MKLRSVLTCLGLLAAAGTPAAAHILFRDFSNSAGLVFVDQAAVVDDALRVCPAVGYGKGAVWYGWKQRVARGFVTRFVYQFSGQNGQGGDGFAFVIQNDRRDTIGSVYGGGLGYSDWPTCGPGGIPASLAIEFDLWMNSEWSDPNDSHISVHTGGVGPNCAHQANSIGWTSAIPDLHDSLPHVVTIRYDPGLLRIWVDDPVQPVLVVPVDLAATLPLDRGTALVGFTAGTGQVIQNHDILSWVFLEE